MMIMMMMMMIVFLSAVVFTAKVLYNEMCAVLVDSATYFYHHLPIVHDRLTPLQH